MFTIIFMRFSWTLTLIGINLLVFFAQLFSPFVAEFAFVPLTAFSEPWTFVTSIFMHAGFSHLFFNMFALFIFGLSLESRISQRSFLIIYFISGIVGNLAYFYTDPLSIIPAVGASGAIYGVMGILAVLAPGMMVFVGGLYPLPMILVAIFYAYSNFVGLFSPSGIAYQAHLGGLFIGVVAGIYLRLQSRKERYRFFFK